jgi:uncharacterized protein (DUF1778 family)
MNLGMKEETAKTRFDTRLSVKEKKLLEKAASIGGFRSLSEFVLRAAQRQAEEIIRKHELVIASEKDSAIFFETILNPEAPNKKLKDAAKKFKLAK